MKKQEQLMQQCQHLHDYNKSIAAMIWIMPRMSILDDLLPLKQPLQRAAAQQHQLYGHPGVQRVSSEICCS